LSRHNRTVKYNINVIAFCRYNLTQRIVCTYLVFLGRIIDVLLYGTVVGLVELQTPVWSEKCRTLQWLA